MKESLRKTTYF